LPTPQELDHATWIEKIPKVVFSRTLQAVTWNNTTLIRENVAERVAALKAEPGDNMHIFGSPRLTHALARLHLVDEYRINLNPVTIGQGVPLFEQGYAANTLNLVRSDRFDCGVIALLYEVVR
jgi:dihydrofolate reductase